MRLNNNSKILFIFLISGFLYSEQYSILSDSVSRTFNAYFPEDTTTQTPMIILLHGLGGSNTDMEIMTDYFIDLGVVPVFPQGFYYEDLGTTLWNHGNIPDLHNDVTFISDIIDYMTEHYEFINHNRIYATGLSNGGYMSYRLACDLSDKITAVASVTGNFYLIDDGTDCVDQNREIPIMHIHGTLDDVVAYYVNGETVFGGDVYGDEDLTIMESIDFWTDYNNLTVETVDTLEADAGFWWYGQWIPTNSIKFTYSSENTNTQFVHIRVEGGGHFWFTSFWGYNWGFESHEEAYNFFMQYQLSDFFNNPAIENFTMNTFENYSFLSWDAIDDDNLNYYLLEKSTDSTFLENV
ncbi:MAG: alpha/beta hydrolase family esterase [Candidatus Neomarinimicrobiota bacterium]